MQFNRFRFAAVAAVTAAVMTAPSAWAVDPFVVRNIRIEGLQRVEPGTVLLSIPVRVGQTYDDGKGAETIRALFALGLFNDVRLEVKDDVLVLIVQERPTVASVEFVGVKEFNQDTLNRAVQSMGLAEGKAFDRAILDRAEQELKRQYLSRSLYATQVKTSTVATDNNQIKIIFNVVEGVPTKISEIRIVGNKAFSESSLRGLLDLDTGNWLSWYTKSNRYVDAKLDADLQTLRSYYLNRGYLDFKINSTQVAIDPNKTDITITINITEGERFTVSAVKLAGNYLNKDSEFKSLVTIRPGQPYSVDEVAKTSKAFSDYFGNFGYAFAQVQVLSQIDRAKRLVSLTLQANPQQRAYVRRINVTGNSKTRDVVVRRELRQLESSWYDGNKIRLSRDRIDRLGYFSEVTVQTEEVPGAPDQIDLTFNVVEKLTGSVNIGGGYSSGDGLGLMFSVSQDNAFGSGHAFGLNFNNSKTNRSLVLNTTDPYFTPDGVSRTFDLYHRTYRPYENKNYYSLVTSGASIRFGVPFTEIDTVYFGAGIERTAIKPGISLPLSYRDYGEKYGYTSKSFPFTIGWGRDSRDSALAPNQGRYQRLNAEVSFSGEARYMRTTYRFQQFYPLNKKYTAALNFDIGAGKTIGQRSYPLFKNFYGGGLGSVRGFEPDSLGPKDATGRTIGGTRQANLNLELITPFPGAGNDRTLRMFGFLDLGMVGGESGGLLINTNANALRSSFGVGISWISPVGPLRFAFARPLKKFEGDKIQSVQFQIGTIF